MKIFNGTLSRASDLRKQIHAEILQIEAEILEDPNNLNLIKDYEKVKEDYKKVQNALKILTKEGYSKLYGPLEKYNTAIKHSAEITQAIELKLKAIQRMADEALLDETKSKRVTRQWSILNHEWKERIQRIEPEEHLPRVTEELENTISVMRKLLDRTITRTEVDPSPQESPALNMALRTSCLEYVRKEKDAYQSLMVDRAW